jgi:hypothetical protein
MTKISAGVIGRIKCHYLSDGMQRKNVFLAQKTRKEAFLLS